MQEKAKQILSQIKNHLFRKFLPFLRKLLSSAHSFQLIYQIYKN